MNLVGGYDSSDDDNDSPGEKQEQSHSPIPKAVQIPQQAAKGKGKAKAAAPPPPPIAAPAAPATTKKSGDGGKGKRKEKTGGKSRTKHKKKGKKTKTVNAFVLSPEIQAALARGDTLGDSDSDEPPEKRPPRIVRPPGSNPNDLLSLLPQPSTVASADDILLKSQLRRRDAAAARATAAAAVAADAPPREAAAARGIEAERLGGEAVKPSTAARAEKVSAHGGPEEDGEESDSDGDEDDLLANMRAKSASGGPETETSASSINSAPLFTLPARSKQPPLAPANAPGAPALEAERGEVLYEGVGAIGASGSSGPAISYVEPSGFVAGEQAAGRWGGGVDMYEGGMYAGDKSAAAAADGMQGMAYGTSYQQSPCYPGSATPAGLAPEQAAGGHETEFGGAGGKSGRRKERDMERALARGDLGALGNETPVMDLHQGSNEFNPLRSKPITAAMKQDQKHIESSVYDPRTGKTVKTLEPTSMQKRKHQINQLAVQAASMERDLMERSGASRLTKAQTHAKYGW